MQHVHTLRVDMHRLSVDDPVVVAGGMGHDALDLDLDNEKCEQGYGSKLATNTSSVTIEYLGVG